VSECISQTIKTVLDINRHLQYKMSFNKAKVSGVAFPMGYLMTISVARLHSVKSKDDR
jgi:hypothetical protein